MTEDTKIKLPLWRLMGIREHDIPESGIYQIEQEPEEALAPGNWLSFDVQQEVEITLNAEACIREANWCLRLSALLNS